MNRCYLCAGANLREIHPRTRDKADLPVMECADCGLVFLKSFDHISADYYEKSGMFEFKEPKVSEEEQADTLRRVATLRNQVAGKCYLDFGCGYGRVAGELAPLVSKVGVVEPNRSLHKYLSETIGLETFESVGKIREKFDVISAFHVVEHLPDPAGILRELSEHLTAEGFLHVEVPSSGDALLRLYDCNAFRDFSYWSCHLFLFNPRTIEQLADKAGLQILDQKQVQRYPLANHLYWLSQGKPGGHKVWSSLRDPELEKSYADKLGQLGMCDTLEVRLVRK